MPDCGDNSCLYVKKRTGMRTNSHCRCDDCPYCGTAVRPTSPHWHRDWCKMKAWIPPHHRGKMQVQTPPTIITLPGVIKFMPFTIKL